MPVCCWQVFLTITEDTVDIRIRVSRADLAYYNLTSVPLADGSGYAAELGVHHELHCLVGYMGQSKYKRTVELINT